MRKLGIVIAIVVVLLVVVIVVVPLVLDVNRYHGLVQSQLEKALGRPVTFGQMHLSLAPPQVRLDNVVIGEAPDFGAGPFASMRYIDAALKIGPLLHGTVELQSLTLDQPNVQLVKNPRGIWNFSTLGQAQPAPSLAAPQTAPAQPSTGAPQQPAPPKSGGEVLLQDLEIKNGQVTLVDMAKRTRGVYNNIDASVEGYAPGKTFDVTVAMHLPGPGRERLQLSGTAGPMAPDNFLNTPFKGKLALNEVSLAGVQKVANAQALAGIDGVASGSLDARNQNGTLSSEGSLKVEDAVIHGVRIGYPIALDYNFSDDLNRDLVRIDSAKLLLGQTPLKISGTINAAPTPAQLDVKLDAQNASIEEAARLASAFGVAFNPGMKVSGGLTADVHVAGPASSPQLNGTLTARDLRISGGELKQPVDVTAMTLTMTPRDIRSNPFTASSGGTSVAVQFVLTNYAGPSPAIDATVRTANAQIAELLGIANAYGVTAVQGMTGNGRINLDVHATGPMKDSAAMNFSGSGRIEAASLKTPQLTQPLNVRNADLRFSSNAMTLQNLAASIGHTNAGGNLTVRNFNAPQLQFALTADRLNVAEMQQLVAAQPAQQKRAALSWSLIPRAQAQAAAAPGLLDKVTGNGAVSIGAVEYDQLVLQNVKSNVTLDRGIIRMSPLTATLYGGQESGSIIVDTRPTPIAVTVSSKLQQVDANQLLSSVSPVKQTLYGLLSANADSTFRAASAQDIARTLNGKVNLDLAKGRLAHIDVLNQLASIGRFLQGVPAASAQPFTDIVRLTGTFDVVNGLAQTNNLKAVIPGASLAADGAVNLANEGLNLHLTAVLSKEMSQQVGGTQVGGFMNTALANNNGELVIPVLVSGTFSNPRFAPDVQKLAQMKLQNMLPTASNPGSLTSGILGAVLGRGQNQQQGAGQPGGLGGILGAITGQQQQQQKQPQPANPPVAQPPSNQPPQAQAQPQQQPQNAFGNLLNQVLGQKKRQQQQPQQQPQQPPPPPQQPPK